MNMGAVSQNVISPTSESSILLFPTSPFCKRVCKICVGRTSSPCARQQHIHTDAGDYFIDLVFYNVVLKCYVLVDLKVGKITHQDVGQMDMYVRMYDDLRRTEGDNPTIGIVLCSETDADIARYSILKGNEQLFATKYKLVLPTEEQLYREIKRQKQLFLLQHAKEEQL